jgi:hypothetical protein
MRVVTLVLASLVFLAQPVSAQTDLGGAFAYDPSFTGGVHVAVCGPDSDGLIWTIFGPGAGGGPHVIAIGSDGVTSIDREWLAYSPDFTGGVFVACQADPTLFGALVITTPGPGGGPHVRFWSVP